MSKSSRQKKVSYSLPISKNTKIKWSIILIENIIAFTNNIDIIEDDILQLYLENDTSIDCKMAHKAYLNK